MKRLRHLCLILLAGLCLPLPARELAAYRIGDIAETDIATPVDLDVPDATATALLQAVKAREFPAVFRSYPAATNILTDVFLAAFAEARSNFLAELAGAFHAAAVDETVIASAEFGRLVTVFDVEHKNFPITDELAAAWARGDSGQASADRLLAALKQAAGQPICPAGLPKDMVIGEMIRLVAVTDREQKLSVDTVEQSPLVPATNVLTLASAQAQFRRKFPAGQQLLARALAGWLKPNCELDVPFTQLTRGTAVCQLTVANHFDAGNYIVHQGERIDAKMLAALAVLNEKLKASPPSPLDPLPAVVAVPAVPVSPPPRAPIAVAPVSPMVVPPPPVVTVKVAGRHTRLIRILAAISAGALAVAGWQYLRLRRTAAPATPNLQVILPLPEAGQLELAPPAAQVMHDAVLQELAMQRRTLLLAQQAAAEEIAALVQRLDESQLPMQKRLHAYESRIHALEQELAGRAEENRELVAMKIEMIRLRLETERTATASLTTTGTGLATKKTL